MGNKNNDHLYVSQRQCTYWFPEKFKTPPTPNVDATNKAYGGWDLTAKNLFFANGKRKNNFLLNSPTHKTLSDRLINISSIVNHYSFTFNMNYRILTLPLLLFFIGDPWRDATVSSDFHTRQSTDLQPIALSDGFHCSDLISASGVDPTILAIQQEALSKIKEWLSAWTPPSASEEGKHEPVPTQSQSGSRIVKPLNSWLRKAIYLFSILIYIV